MYSAELPMEFLIEISNLMGLDQALKQRFEIVYPIFALLKAVKSGRLASDEIKNDMSKDFDDFKSSARSLRRTFKGLEQIASKFMGEPKGLEVIGIDRVKQATEEARRLKGDFASLLREFDDKVRKSTRPILIGAR